jgi:Ribbon-helix-helix protein, copG family
MVRTQIQLTENQTSALKKLAAKKHVSIAELIRQAVDILLHSHAGTSKEERQQRAILAAGCLRFRRNDISENHDIYLAEAYNK